ncbi:hypothetical protein DEO72_LG3g1626 [Vigna unguiculata]|uniref:Uncharacterized protein n=1 Tax=Vigna unguiculata TaxID=3917 RepID=A0A4D6LFX8_VIGUN|nr:hypothetical protein DEO72_LG3g1626 [Vigna unguiculata]
MLNAKIARLVFVHRNTRQFLSRIVFSKSSCCRNLYRAASSTSRRHPPLRYHHRCVHLEHPRTNNHIHIYQELDSHRETSIFSFTVRETEIYDPTQHLHVRTCTRIIFFLATSAM